MAPPGRHWLIAACAAVLCLMATGCGGPPAPPGRNVEQSAAKDAPRFEDITTKAGISWVHNPCRTGRKYLPETVGGGGGFIDYNSDGWQDILLINGAPLPGYNGPRPSLALYRNNHNGTFTDVTQGSGLDLNEYALGLAVADYDNDGWPDVLITCLGKSHLFHNEHGHFRDVTARMGLNITGFATAAAWIDYDRDGKLDLFAGRYVEWTPASDLPCGPASARQYCPPNQYQGRPPLLFHNTGRGFEDVSVRSGVTNCPGKTLGIVPFDFNGDGWIDLYVANDTEPDSLFINQHNGTFVNQALVSGVALGTDGSPTGSMGADAATPMRDGRSAIAVGTFAGQEMSLFVQQKLAAGGMLFDNLKQPAGFAQPTHGMTTFGLVYADVDLDGWPDVVAMNGHIDDDQSLRLGGRAVSYRQPAELFLNQRDGTFREMGVAAGLGAPVVGRGLAVGDIDNDGRPDLLMFENGGPVRLMRNITATRNGWLGIRLRGVRSPRDGTGAMVTVSGPGWSQTLCATTTRSYLSACDPRLLFGLGTSSGVRVTVKWPSGTETTVTGPPINRYIDITER